MDTEKLIKCYSLLNELHQNGTYIRLVCYPHDTKTQWSCCYYSSINGMIVELQKNIFEANNLNKIIEFLEEIKNSLN